jgi:hypothetical protein
MNVVSDPLISYFDQNIWSAITSPEFAVQRKEIKRLVQKGKMIIPVSPIVLEETQKMEDLGSRSERAKIISTLCNNQYFPPSVYIRDLEIFKYLKTGTIGNISRKDLMFPHPFGGRSFYCGGTDIGSMSINQALDLMDSKQWKYQAENFQEDSLKQFESEVIDIKNQPTPKKITLCKERLIKKLISGQNKPCTINLKTTTERRKGSDRVN